VFVGRGVVLLRAVSCAFAVAAIIGLAACGGNEEAASTSASAGASGATGAAGPATFAEAQTMLLQCLLNQDEGRGDWKVSFDKRADNPELTVKTDTGDQLGVGMWHTQADRDKAVAQLERGGATVDVHEAITVAYDAQATNPDEVDQVTGCVEDVPQE
jgi:hypothetical protein